MARPQGPPPGLIVTVAAGRRGKTPPKIAALANIANKKATGGRRKLGGVNMPRPDNDADDLPQPPAGANFVPPR